MSKRMAVVLSAMMICGACLAKDAAPAAKAMHQDHLNNVITMDASGNRTALCMCGKEFPVTDKSLSVQTSEQTLFCCTEGCHAMAAKLSSEQLQEAATDFFKTTFPNDKMVTNIFVKDGRKMAACLCGKTVEVNDKTPKITENGMTLYVCSDACNTSIHGMSAADRMNAEKSRLSASATKETKSQ